MNQRIYHFWVIYSKWNIPIRYYLFQSLSPTAGHGRLASSVGWFQHYCYLHLFLITHFQVVRKGGIKSDVISWDQTLQINGDFFQIKLERELNF